MPALTAADTIRILVATDNHVGYNERDPVRGDDSWKTFHEITCLAKDRDVDMVLLAGDLFHENKPSRKSMYNVMRSLRMNCYGEKPCELEMLSDASETLGGDFNHVNYEDPDINVAIPVFSIHGNHDDPSGEGHYAALDLLQCSGLLNYYGRTPESDKINVKPVLLQKGRTKVALYGLSNVRDERLYRTFRDGKVKFFQPGTQKEDWFNIMSVHQNHHAYTETSHLPENFLPDFLDLVIWGHEHECDIQPHINPEMNFKVMQPGSSVATSLVAGEAVPKQVVILSITGRELKCEPIRLKTVRPFVYKDLVLGEHKEAVQIARKENHRTELTRFLVRVVDELIEQAIAEWRAAQEEHGVENDEEDRAAVPLPLIRLRVETSIPNSTASFDVENPQRFSNRFVGKVANTNDVVQFHRKKKTALGSLRNAAGGIEEQEIMSHLQGLDTVKVEQLVREFLAAQSLTILPQNYFGDAVSQFVDKDDKHAMESFVNESLTSQIKHLLNMNVRDVDEEEDDDDEDSLAAQINHYRSRLEEMFSKGVLKKSKSQSHRFKPRPSNWDSDLDGNWEDQPGALLRPDEDTGSVMEEAAEEADETSKSRGTRGRDRAGRRGAGAAIRETAAAARKPLSVSSRGRKKAVEEDQNDDEDNGNGEDVLMLDDDDDDEDDSQAMFFKERTNGARARGKEHAPHITRTRKAASPIKKLAPRSTATKGRQATLNFTASQASVLGHGRRGMTSPSLNDHIEDDEDDDEDEDAFEPVSNIRSKTRK